MWNPRPGTRSWRCGEMERSYYLLTFESTHAAMAAEQALLPRLPVRVMPTLRQITASCGISLRVEEADYPTLEWALAEGAVEPDTYRLYRVEPPQAWEIHGKAE